MKHGASNLQTLNNMNEGYVYLIGTPIFGWYKIGKSRTPEVRVKDLGILLPFKIEIIGIWKAKNHHLMESSLHEIYKDNKINGEWFEFTKKEAYEVFSSIPAETRIYPIDNREHLLDRFSNVAEDLKGSRKVLGVKVQKLRGNFTEKEREKIRDTSIEHQKMRKILKNINGYSTISRYQLACNKPYTDKKIKLNIFTSIVEH